MSPDFHASVDRNLHIEGNAGWGGSAGFVVDANKNALSVNKAIIPKAGGGFGAMLGGGGSQTVTFAPFAPLW
jgi:hypothetical protein